MMKYNVPEEWPQLGYELHVGKDLGNMQSLNNKEIEKCQFPLEITEQSFLA
jgi:hypothetical protein